MKVLVVIPARYASTRFPGKPLALINGQPMIKLIVDRVQELNMNKRVVVATDDQRIADTVNEFGGEAIMTKTSHQSGTDRCAEVVALLDEYFDLVLNVQGDEPGIAIHSLELLVEAFSDKEVSIATLKNVITDLDSLKSSHVVKVVTDKQGYAMYFSRLPIPSVRDLPVEKWFEKGLHFQHQGIYAFRPEAILALTNTPPSNLEQAESLEQLRWMDEGYKIRVIKTPYKSIGIDTPEDLENFVRGI